jgi:hypothetical protein
MTAEHDVTLYELQRHAEEAANRVACVASDLTALAAYLERTEYREHSRVWLVEQLRRKAEELGG